MRGRSLVSAAMGSSCRRAPNRARVLIINHSFITGGSATAKEQSSGGMGNLHGAHAMW